MLQQVLSIVHKFAAEIVVSKLNSARDINGDKRDCSLEVSLSSDEARRYFITRVVVLLHYFLFTFLYE